MRQKAGNEKKKGVWGVGKGTLLCYWSPFLLPQGETTLATKVRKEGLAMGPRLLKRKKMGTMP